MRLGSKDKHTCPPNTGIHESTRARVPLSHESEKVLEARFRTEIERLGGMAVKLSSQMHRGLPDRFVLMPEGLAFFAEIKSTGERPTRLQKHCHQQLRDLGFDVYVIDSTAGLEKAVAQIDRAIIAARIQREELGL